MFVSFVIIVRMIILIIIHIIGWTFMRAYIYIYLFISMLYGIIAVCCCITFATRLSVVTVPEDVEREIQSAKTLRAVILPELEDART